MRKLVLAWFVFFSFPYPEKAEAQPRRFTLEETLEYALQHSPQLDSSKRRLLISDLEKRNAQSQFLPSIDLSATHGLQDTVRPGPSDPAYPTDLTGSEDPWVSQFSLGVTENLYDNGESFTNYQISKLKKEQNALLLEQEKEKLCLELTQEFFRYSLLTKLYEIQQDQYALIKKQYHLISSSYYQGLQTRRDYLRFKTQLHRTELNLSQAKNNLEKSRMEVLKILSLSPEGPEGSQFIFIPDERRPHLEKLPKDFPALENHFESKIFQLQKQISALEVELVKRKDGPEFALSSGVTYQSDNYLGGKGMPEREGERSGLADRFFNRDHLNWNILLSIKYNLWDWGTRNRNHEIAAAQSLIQSNEHTQKIIHLQTEIQKILMDLHQSQEDFKLAQELLKLERDNYDFIDTEYRNGKVQYLDLIEGLNNLADAKIKYFTSLYEIKQGLSSYHYHEGTLYESLSSSPKK